jgi:hypothetical protein
MCLIGLSSNDNLPSSLKIPNSPEVKALLLDPMAKRVLGVTGILFS